MLDEYWDKWLNELKIQTYCTHLVLEQYQYLIDVIE